MAIARFVALALTAFVAVSPAYAQDAKRAPAIIVTGNGSVTAKPDAAEINAGVVSQGRDAAAALAANNVIVARMLETLTQAGVNERDVQTVFLSIAPQYEASGPSRRPAIVGYEVANQLRIVVRDIANAGRLLDALVARGANRVSGISFAVNDPKGPADAARRLAVADARRKAELYAQVAGVKLGHVVSISEQQVGQTAPVFLAMREGTPVAPGELVFAASVTIIYDID